MIIAAADARLEALNAESSTLIAKVLTTTNAAELDVIDARIEAISDEMERISDEIIEGAGR